MPGARDNGKTHVANGDQVRIIHPAGKALMIPISSLRTNTVVTVIDSLPDSDGNVRVEVDGKEYLIFLGCLGRPL